MYGMLSARPLIPRKDSIVAEDFILPFVIPGLEEQEQEKGTLSNRHYME
jgi:hypothetical protein